MPPWRNFGSGPGLEATQKLGGSHPGDAKGLAQVEQIPIARHKVLRAGGQRGRQNGLILGIPSACCAQQRGFHPLALEAQPRQGTSGIDVGNALALQRAGHALALPEDAGRDGGEERATGQTDEGTPVTMTNADGTASFGHTPAGNDAVLFFRATAQ